MAVLPSTRLAALVLMLSLAGPALGTGVALSQSEAIAAAERFVAENGYTADQTRIKSDLDLESIEWVRGRSELLKWRFNTLAPRAIGVRQGRKGDRSGWSVAFDYTPSASSRADSCRVVTMDADGSAIRVEHVSGIRRYFAGFDKPPASSRAQ